MRSQCVCGVQESMSHIYNCEQLNQESEQKLKYENIFNGNIWDQIEVFKTFELNLLK